MFKKSAIDIDNRDASQMYEYLEARIDVLKRRLAELEAEKPKAAEQRALRTEIGPRRSSLISPNHIHDSTRLWARSGALTGKDYASFCQKSAG